MNYPPPCTARECVHHVAMSDHCAKCLRLLAAYRRFEGPLVCT